MKRISKAEYKYLRKFFKDNMFTKTVHNTYIVEEYGIMHKLDDIRKSGIKYGNQNEANL